MIKSVAIAHALGGLSPHAGGTTRVVIDLTDALASHPELAITLVSQSLRGSSTVYSASDRVHRVIAESNSRRAQQLGLPFRGALNRLHLPQGASLIHSHGVWMAVNHWTARCARERRLPLVLQPHGMLEPWAMSFKAWKKRVAMGLYQWRDLQTAQVLVATAEAEYENLRAFGLRQPIAIIPNGIHMPVASHEIPVGAHHQSQQRTALFLSRIHPKKGLLNLIDAWAQMQAGGWRLQIAGPDEGGHLAEVMARARQMGVSDAVEYVGMVEGEAKSALYRRADLFVLPTFTENFGVVVAESLAHGLPVITTRGAPWADLETYGCGWWIDTGVEPLVQALREAMALSDEQRHGMGARGQDYVRRYDWGGIAAQTAAVYRWVLGQGDKPDCVQIG